ncbi:SDR family oxidoreductase [Nocardiopsis sp. RSe5-2]|uniref:SDR family oxidoreductase n=1 Tax=Nocardiopsis endophytica TaxID=3018445 RepID=A0ABT4U3J8_9ACTN|nr:SDR family oxidoreductase [Nocardiopsis endophytica]MDA2811531.1 SDR family oxidoreductase [Nocardiopsis endophytica]
MIDTGLDGAAVLVTGAAGNIGAAIARAFAAQGARVALHYLGSDPREPDGVGWEHVTPGREAAEALAEELRGAAVEADLSDPEAPARLLDRAEEEVGPLRVLVNNAAHCESPDAVGALSAAGLERTYRVNTFAPALLVAGLARRAADRPGPPPCAVNISTDAARAFPGQTGYGTSKAALEAFTRSAAIDLGPAGVRVNAVAPGPVQTGWMDPDLVERVRPVIPLGRVGAPDDIADAVVFLASRQARWITGQVLQVAGGHAL